MSRLSQPFRDPRTGVFYFRRMVPKALRPILGKWEWKRSLGTKYLAEAKTRYLQEALNYESAIDALKCGKPVNVPSPVRHQEANPTITFAGDPTHTVGWAMERWFEERKPAAKTQYEWKRIITAFGADRHLRTVLFNDMRDYKSSLLALGHRANTVDKKLTAFRTVFRWALRNKYIERDPTAGVRVEGLTKRRKKERNREPYTREEARLILKAARKEKGALRWVPWVLAATGCRIQECCQAFVADIKKENGITYLLVTSKGEGQSLKTEYSERRVPLHSRLMAEGFGNYAKSLPKGARLFPDLAPDRFGNWGANFGKQYGRWAREIVPQASKVAHSWRHSFKSWARDAGISEDVHDALTGHAGGGVGREYGRISLTILAKAVDAIDFGMNDSGKTSRSKRL